MTDTNAPEQTIRHEAQAIIDAMHIMATGRWSFIGATERRAKRIISLLDALTPVPREDGYSAGVRAALAQMSDDPTGKSSVTSPDYPAWFVGRYRSAIALLDAPALPDARAGAVEMRERCVAEIEREFPGRLYASNRTRCLAAIRALPLYAAPPTPACTATDGPASACVYRAPGLGTAATFEKG